MNIFILVLLALFMGTAQADEITLNTPETLSVPTATKLVWEKIDIYNAEKVLRVRYHWEAADGTELQVDDSRTFLWTCEGSCFTDTFGFTIRTEDVGTKLGLGLRALIWSKMRPDVLTGDNDGSFD